MRLLAVGGAMDDLNNFIPAKKPDDNDEIVCNPSTGDLYFTDKTKMENIDLTDFGGDVIYDVEENRIHDIFRNYELDLFFIEQPQFTRLR